MRRIRGGIARIERLEGRMLLNGVGPRLMENLDRGVVAVRSSTSAAFVSWRLLGLDAAGVGFNVYRSGNGGVPVKLNASPLTGGTNFTDSTVNFTVSNSYFVRPVIGGQEADPSRAFTMPANVTTEPVVRIPLRPGGAIKFVWVGDLDGDGEYDYVLDRQTAPQKIEAYRRDGTFLWEVDMGPNSLNQDNIEGGSSTIDVGHNDGVTVYDFDSDGKAEVAVRIANGVTFGNGVTFTNANNNLQWIAILDGMTGALRATAPVPTDYLADGPMYARFGVGYLDGRTPSLVAYMKNRIGNGGFNLMSCAWDFNGTWLTRKWKFLRGNQDLPDGHNTRIVDVDGDGKDEIAEIGFVLNGNGTLRYSLGPLGVVHGDRFHIAKMDPTRPGLQGYGVQQDNPSGLLEYYYDATDGTILWQHVGAVSDVGRGMAADIDPRFPGMEVWSFSGLYNGPTNQLTEPNTSLRPWPQLGFWWDGDLLSELLNDGKFEQWNWLVPTATNAAPRLLTTWHYGAVGSGVNPLLYGDLFGDWREEAVYSNSTFDQLIIFTTFTPTSERIYTLAQNPAYRNAMTLKGYMQSHHLDYFLGEGMAPPPVPNIEYVDSTAPVVTQASYYFATAPNRLDFTFDEPVTIATGAMSLLVTRLEGGSVAASGFSYDPLTHTASFTLPLGLADGNYVASFVPGSVVDASGNALGGGYSFGFFVLGGDANRDRVVDLRDLYILSLNWLGSGKTFGEGDFSYDGVVDKTDLTVLSRAWQTKVEVPVAPSEPAPTGTSPRGARRTPVRVLADVGLVT